jgi:hypothetical protein
MTAIASRLHDLAGRQHEVLAGWQLRAEGFRRGQVDTAFRGLRRVFRDVCALGDLDELGWYMAAALAYGPSAAISHVSALMLLELRPYEPGDIHVSALGGERAVRPGLIPHRRRHMETGTCHGIPVTSPNQSLRDANLEPYELYRALEEAEKLGYHTSLPLNDVVRLKQAVRGYTRSDAEARALLLFAEAGFPLPLVNHRLNGIETDLHWPHERLVVEVDGWEFHKEREQFEEDRRRGLVHNAVGYTVTRVSASEVKNQPELVLAGVRGLTGWR